MSPEPGYRICPQCRGEYTAIAVRCVDCDVELVSGDAELPEEVAQEAFPPASDLTCVRVAPVAWVRALSGALGERGVGHRIEPAAVGDAPEGQSPDVFGDVQLFGLYVREEDTAAARAIDGTIAARLLPEEAPPLEDGEEETCPACGTALGAEATECPDCGLGFA